MRRNTSARGFTLAEILVVVGILGIVGLIAGVQINSFANKSNLEGATGEIRTFLDSAKAMTVRENGAITVRFAVVGGQDSLQLLNATGGTRATLTLPRYVRAALNPGATAPGAWPVPTPAPWFTCDTLGRTLSPAGTQVTTTQTVAITHRGMLDQAGFVSLRPRLRYDIQIFPLWQTSVVKRPY